MKIQLETIEKNEVDFALVSVLPENLKLNRIELMENKLFLFSLYLRVRLCALVLELHLPQYNYPKSYILVPRVKSETNGRLLNKRLRKFNRHKGSYNSYMGKKIQNH